MKNILLKSILGIVICSMVTIAPCGQAIAQNKKFKPAKSLSSSNRASHWQQQVKWINDGCKKVFPELTLVGWREAGTLDSPEAIEKFVTEEMSEDKMFSHSVYEQGQIKDHVVATRTELNKRYGIWTDAHIEGIKSLFLKEFKTGEKIIELKWNYKGKEFIEKIAVSDKIDNYGNSIKFSTIGANIYFPTGDAPKAKWQIENQYRSMTEINFAEYDKVGDDYWKSRFDHIKKNPITEGLKMVGYELIGTVKSEKQKIKFLEKSLSDKAYFMWYNRTPKGFFHISTLGELKRSSPNHYEVVIEHAKSSLRSLKLGYDKVVRVKWEYKGKKFETYAFVSSYVRKSNSSTANNKWRYLIYDNIMKTINLTESAIEHKNGGHYFRYSSIANG